MFVRKKKNRSGSKSKAWNKDNSRLLWALEFAMRPSRYRRRFCGDAAGCMLPISPQRAVELTQTMYELRFELPNDPEVQHVLLKMDTEQQMLYDLTVVSYKVDIVF